MKKQLLIAAVAATMTSVAMADISITGKMKVNSKTTDQNGTNTNAISHEANLYIAGKSGGTDFYMELDSDSGDFTTTTATASTTTTNPASTAGLDVEDIWMKTSVEGVTVKAGTWNGSDNILNADSARGAGKYSLSGTVAGVDVTFEGQGNAQASTGTTLATTLGGVDVSYKNESHQDQFKASGTVAGLNYAIHHVDADAASSDKTSTEFSYDFNGVTISAAQANAQSSATITGDSYFGDVTAYQTAMAANDDIKGLGLKTDVAGNTLQAKFWTMEDASAGNDVDFVKLVATRALANGVTLEVIYQDEDNTTASSDKEFLDVELAVKF